jgi:hypothetical protein
LKEDVLEQLKTEFPNGVPNCALSLVEWCYAKCKTNEMAYKVEKAAKEK